MECVNNPDYKKAISMLNQNGKPAKKNTQAKIPNVAQVAAMEELSKLNEQFCHTFKQSFSSIITNIPDSHIIMKPTKSEKKKKKRQVLRNAAKCLEGQWHETVVERGLGIRQSFQSRSRERIVRSFERIEAKGLIEKKDHVGDATKMNWNKEDFLKDVENLEFSLTEVNWSDMARKYEVIDGSGELAKNGGQIIKEYARSSGIDVDSISKKRKNGNPIVGKCKKRFISSCVSVPVDCSNTRLKTELGKRIESGEFSIGVPINSTRYKKYCVNQDSIILQEVETEGRKFELEVIRQLTIKKQMKFMRSKPPVYYETISDKFICDRLKQLNEYKTWRSMEDNRQLLQTLEAHVTFSYGMMHQ